MDIDLVDIVKDVATHPVTQIVGLYLANHLAVAVVRTQFRTYIREKGNSDFFCDKEGDLIPSREKFKRSWKRRALKTKTYIYSAIMESVELLLYYNIKN